jgi:acyl-CoA oxidase
LTKFDKESSDVLKDMLFGDNLSKRQKWHDLFANDPVFFPKYDLSLDEQRDLAYKRIKAVSDAKLFSIFDFESDPVNLFTAHEMIGCVDGSLSTKFTVQFNLFGGTLMALHTDRHLPFMKDVDSLKVMGCFCFTELGYGNNAPKMETTAIYNSSKQEFTINCPTPQAQKYWITNGACHANWAIVFAQTIVDGKNEGVNSFLVQIRDEKMNCMPGVFIEDMGVKMGLNGVDNGRIVFTNVQIKRD